MSDQTPPNSPPDDDGRQPAPKPLWQKMLLPMFFLIVLLSLFARMGERTPATDVAYSDFKAMVSSNQVTEVVLRGDLVEGQLHGSKPIGPAGQQSEVFRTRIPASGDEALLPLLEEFGVTVNVEPPASETGWGQVLLSLLPWLIFIGVDDITANNRTHHHFRHRLPLGWCCVLLLGAFRPTRG